jgi:hypothetical protein
MVIYESPGIWIMHVEMRDMMIDIIVPIQSGRCLIKGSPNKMPRTSLKPKRIPTVKMFPSRAPILNKTK